MICYSPFYGFKVETSSLQELSPIVTEAGDPLVTEAGDKITTGEENEN